ncbi:MAG: 3-deoxy-7-phosphoheptulonate synthase [Planctomycetota bacterium]
MIIVCKPNITEGELQHILDRIAEMGLTPHVSRGVHRTVVGVIGEEDQVRSMPLAAIAGVDQVMPVLAPYKRASREFQPADTIVNVGGVAIGGDHFTVIAGPCVVESEEQTLAVARAVRDAGARVLRGGAFKPRTSPYSFQGLGEDGLKILARCSAETGLPIVTEVMDTRQVAVVARYAQMLQVGARNMQNFNLLSEVGRSGMPVLLKRGSAGTVRELLMSAEYILAAGNSQVVLCERGIRTFEDSVRFTLDLSCIPTVLRESHLPIVVDPSHAAGRWDLVPALARGAIATGAHGVMVEVHCCPEEARCDGPQQLLPRRFAGMMESLRAIARAVGKTM